MIEFAAFVPAGYSPHSPREEFALRIAIVIERFVPGAGGVENVAWQVAHELDRQGANVTIVTREAADTTTLPVEVVYAPATWQPTRLALFSRGAARVTHSGGFDVVHSFSHTRSQDLFRAGGGTQLEHLRRNHHGLGRAIRHVSPRYRVRLAVEGHVFRKSTQRIQCSSRLVANAIQRDYDVPNDRILLLPNAVDEAFFGDDALMRTADTLRLELNSGTARIWLFPGSGWHRKGLATALTAFAATRDSNTHLWIAGRDGTATWLRRVHELGIATRVRFLGERSDMPRVYHAADAVVLPTRYDPFANVTLEAAAAGRPIVTTAANGAAEWLGEDIVVVREANDVDAFTAGIDQYNDNSTAKEVGPRLVARARGFDWPSHVRTLREEYQEITSRREGAPS